MMKKMQAMFLISYKHLYMLGTQSQIYCIELWQLLGATSHTPYCK